MVLRQVRQLMPSAVLMLLVTAAFAISDEALRELVEAESSSKAIAKEASYYDEDMARAFAALSKLAYCGPGPDPVPPFGSTWGIKQTILVSCGIFCTKAGFKITNVELVPLADLGQANANFAYVAKLEKAEWWSEKLPADCMVVFRGTWVHPANDEENVNQTMYDFGMKYCDHGCKAVGGALKVWNDMKSSVLERLKIVGCDLGSTVSVTGHSSGGQVAALAMWSLQEVGYKVGLSYTFAAPTPFNSKAAAVFDFLLFPERAVSLFRITHANDVAPRMPMGVEFAQPGFQVWYPSTGSKHILCGSRHNAPKCGIESIPSNMLCKMTGSNPVWRLCGSSAPYGGPHCEHPLAPAQSFCSFAGNSEDRFLSASAATCRQGQLMQAEATGPTYPPGSWPGHRASEELDKTDHEKGVPPAQANLEACLRGNIEHVQMKPYGAQSSSTDYDAWRVLLNRLPSASASPLAIARPVSEGEVQAAVRCAAAIGLQVCARGGGNGFDNKAGCHGGVQIDVRGLLHYRLDHASKVVSFGTGFWLGSLYYNLAQSSLVVPAGTISSVGAAGLILGCGHGVFATIYGLACDSILSVDYVDSSGLLQEANVSQNLDMFWLAKGGGGIFPGIVTRIRMQAYDMPNSVMEVGCTWTFGETTKKSVLKAWFAKQAELSDPGRKVYSTVTMNNQPSLRVNLLCLGCSDVEQGWVRDQFNTIKMAAPSNDCYEKYRSWLDQIVYESGENSGGVFAPNSETGLLDRSNGWGSKPAPKAMLTNGRLGYSWDVPDSLIDAIYQNTFAAPSEGAWSMVSGLYPISGPKVTGINRAWTVYGHREAKWTLHWKYLMDSDKSLDFYQTQRQHSIKYQNDLDQLVPCTNFYNYVDTDGMTCAARGSGDQWLKAYFGDVARLKRTKSLVDAKDTIRTAPAPAPSPAPKPVPTWTKVTTTGLVSPRVDAGSYMWRSRLCLIGGRGAQSVECLMTSTGLWTHFNTVTQDVHHMQPVVWQEEVWIVAGWEGPPGLEKDLENVIVYSPRDDKLRNQCQIPQEFRVGAAGVVTHGDFIYVVGGSSRSRPSAKKLFSRFAPWTCKWVPMPALAHSRDSFQAALVGSVVVLASGRDTPRGLDEDLLKYPVAPTEHYDLSAGVNGVWMAGADLPMPRSGAASAAVEGLVLVVGGEVSSGRESSLCPPASPNVALVRVDAYNLSANTWSQLPDLTVGRHGAAVAVGDSHGQLQLFATTGARCTGSTPLVQATEVLSDPLSKLTASTAPSRVEPVAHAAAPPTTTDAPTTTTAAPTSTTATPTTTATSTATRTTTTTTTTLPSTTSTSSSTSTASTTTTTTSTSTTTTTSTTSTVTSTTRSTTTATSTPRSTSSTSSTSSASSTSSSTSTAASTSSSGITSGISAATAAATTSTAAPGGTTSLSKAGPTWCFANDTSYYPLDLESDLMTYEKDIWTCQERCRNTPYCEFFTWLAISKACHVTGGWAYRQPMSLGMITGPKDCSSPTPTALTNQQKIRLHEEYYSFVSSDTRTFLQGFEQRKRNSPSTRRWPLDAVAGPVLLIGLGGSLVFFALRSWRSNRSRENWFTRRECRIYFLRDSETDRDEVLCYSGHTEGAQQLITE